MTAAMIPTILITLCALSLAVLLKKPFADTLAPVLFGIILMLYGFYVCDLLTIGRGAVIALCLVLIAVCGYYLAAGKREGDLLKKELSSPTFAVYIIALLIFAVFSSGKFVYFWDSLRLWGAYPKALHTYEALQLGKDAIIYSNMQSYLPGMPLFGYFFTSFSKAFHEDVLFFSYDIFAIALILPLAGGIRRPKGSGPLRYTGFLMGLTAAVIFVPWMVFSLGGDGAYLYDSLFIDPILGICCGYVLFRCFNFFGEDPFENSCIILSCAGLTLLKDSGIFLALCGIAGGMISAFLRPGERKNERRRCAVLSCTACAAVWGVWKYLLSIYTVNNHIDFGRALPRHGLISLADHFFQAPVTAFDGIIFSVEFTLPTALILLFLFKLWMCAYSNSRELKREAAEISVQIFCYGLFFLGYCTVFCRAIEKGSYPSYPRYFSPLIVSALYVVAGDCVFKYASVFPMWISRLKKHKACYKLTSGALTLMIVLMSVSAGMRIMFIDDMLPKWLYSDSKVLSEAIIGGVDRDGKTKADLTDVFLLYPGSAQEKSQYHHRTYFELIDDGIRIKNFYTEVNITSEDMALSPGEFIDMLTAEDYDYVALRTADERLVTEFGELFEGLTVGEEYVVFRVVPQEGRLVRACEPER